MYQLVIDPGAGGNLVMPFDDSGAIKGEPVKIWKVVLRDPLCVKQDQFWVVVEFYFRNKSMANTNIRVIKDRKGFSISPQAKDLLAAALARNGLRLADGQIPLVERVEKQVDTYFRKLPAGVLKFRKFQQS